MRKVLTTLSLPTISLSAAANALADDVTIRKLKTYNRYQIQVDRTEFTVVFHSVTRTCKENLGYLHGDIKKVEIPEGTYTSIQEVVANLQVFEPMMNCETEQDFNLNREVTITNLPKMKFIDLDILFPTDISVSVK